MSSYSLLGRTKSQDRCRAKVAKDTSLAKGPNLAQTQAKKDPNSKTREGPGTKKWILLFPDLSSVTKSQQQLQALALQLAV